MPALITSLVLGHDSLITSIYGFLFYYSCTLNLFEVMLFANLKVELRGRLATRLSQTELHPRSNNI